ncbi:ATP-binding protein [Chloroflexota bacterium]
MPKKVKTPSDSPSSSITERKRAEELYRTLANSSPVGVYIVQDGKFKFVNPQLQVDTGYTEDELLDMDSLSIAHPEDRESVRENAVEMLKGNRLPPYKFRVIVKGGEIKWAMETVTSIQYKGRRATLGNFMDITKRKRLEQEMRKRIKELNCLYGIGLIAGKQDITLDEVYQEVTNLLPASWQYPEITCTRITTNCKEFKTENCKETEWRQSADIKVHGAKAGKVEVCYLEERPEIDEGPFLKEERLLIDTVAERLGRITEHKQAERELQERNEQLDAQNEELQSQAEELTTQQQELVEKSREVERANQLKSEFLAHMSHELRTPLNVIIGFSELMADEVQGKINKEQGQCLDDILSSSQYLLSLISDILDLSKIESGKMELRLSNFAISDLIESLRSAIMSRLTQKKQSLDVKVQEGLPPVSADADRITQVLINLLSNATKFTPKGGKLKIEAVREDKWCRVSVIDNGIGIKKENQERIFESFCQLDNSMVKEKGGTGLGLAITKQIVEVHGWRIWVDSEYGKGSQFTFTLPLATDNEPHPD